MHNSRQSLLGLGEFERVGAELTLTDKPVPDSFRKVAGSDRQVVLTFTVKEKPVIRLSGAPCGKKSWARCGCAFRASTALSGTLPGGLRVACRAIDPRVNL